MIDVTNLDLTKLCKTAYDLSQPLGLGALHFTPEPLTDKEAQEIVDDFKDNENVALSMDYVKGRSCKFHVYRRDGKLEIQDRWYDHNDSQLQELLEASA